jgi:hypothetical protein
MSTEPRQKHKAHPTKTTAKRLKLGHRMNRIISDNEGDQGLSDANSEPNVVNVEAQNKESDEESEGGDEDEVGNDDNAGSGDEEAPEGETDEQELGT